MGNRALNRAVIGRRIFLTSPFILLGSRLLAGDGDGRGLFEMLLALRMSQGDFRKMSADETRQAEARRARGESLPRIDGYSDLGSSVLFQMASAQRRRTFNAVRDLERIQSLSSRRSFWNTERTVVRGEIQEVTASAAAARASGKTVRAIRDENTVSKLTIYSGGVDYFRSNPREGTFGAGATYSK